MVSAKEKMYSKEEKAVIGALRTTYCLAKEEIASSKFSSLFPPSITRSRLC